MYDIEYRDLFGHWRSTPKEFASLDEAKAYCLRMADATDVAYRILKGGEVVDVIDLEAGFFEVLDPPAQDE